MPQLSPLGFPKTRTCKPPGSTSAPEKGETSMSRKVGQIITRGERRWLVRVYLGRHRETRKRTYHNRTIYGSLRYAQALQWEMILEVPTKGAKLPRIQRREMRVFSVEET